MVMKKNITKLLMGVLKTTSPIIIQSCIKLKSSLVQSLSIFTLLTMFSCNQEYKRSIKKSHYTPNSGFVTISDSLQLSRQSSGYSIFLPAAAKEIKGAIIFFQDVPADTSQHLDEMSTVQPAIDKNVAVAFVATGNPFDFLFADADLRRLDSITEQLIADNKLPRNKLLFAGLSLSGTRAMRYATWCQQNKSAFKIHPSGLVLCDAPLDMMRMYDEHNKAVQRNFNALAAGTAAMVLPYLQSHLGNPLTDREKYIAYSPFSYADSLGGNAQYLVNLPVRAYHEPDINWWIKYRRKDYYSMNSLDMAGLINQLLLSGNNKAALITLHHQTTNPDESPHSWSIVDNKELVDWFLKL